MVHATPVSTGLRVEAAAVVDAGGVCACPGALLLDTPDPATGARRVLAAGSPREVAVHPAWAHAHPIDASSHVVIPGLVNAHTHLDLTHIGPRPAPEGGFQGFIDLVRSQRLTDAEAISESVHDGAARCLAAGVVAVGDIAGAVMGRASPIAARALAATGLRGTSFVEFFAIGPSLDRAMDTLRGVVGEFPGGEVGPGLRLGLQPHAPYSVALRGYQETASLSRRLGLPVATHLAETPDEALLVARGEGPCRRFLEQLGLWDASASGDFGRGQSPVAHVLGAWDAEPLLLAHVNQASDRDIELLAARGALVAYCPRASAYFGFAESFGPHRYRDMLRAGIPVALGTDSIVNLPGEAISVWDEMRVLAGRDGTPAATLLSMATEHGAAALGLPRGMFMLGVGNAPAGLLAVPCESPAPGNPLRDALLRGGPPRLLWRAGA